MSIGFWRLVLILVASTPSNLALAYVAFGYACGMSYIDYLNAGIYSGLDAWDFIAIASTITSGYLILSAYSIIFAVNPLSVSCLTKKLEKFSSSFNLKLQNLVTPGR